MIIPRFHLTQTDRTVTITIKAPFCNLDELDTSCDDNVFLFHCSPYHLRLKLPGNIVENAESKVSFNADTSEFILIYGKENVGEDFPNLELITSLLQSKVEVNEGGRKIEIIGDENGEKNAENWGGDKVEYGFGLRGGYDFRNLHNEFDIFKINPHEVKFEDRRILRMRKEQEDFNFEHYAADLMDDAEIREVCKLKCPWDDLKESEIKFSDEELDFMKDLLNIEFNLSDQQIVYCRNSLIDILFAYCYDARTTGFEKTCESHWTIINVSCSLSWFDSFLSPKDALVSAFRRSLIYPIYRSFFLCEQILVDLKKLLSLGEKFIIKCLISIYNVFLHDDSGGYILNNLFIKDYIVYISKWNQNEWEKIVVEVQNLTINRSDLGMNLIELEGSCLNNLEESFKNIKINEYDSDDDSSSDSSEDSSLSEDELSES
ncbi:protein SHQ1 homolog [Onthophagus taurus]|uniref:protein SHQ1 homolog n=1 Tax=Onthophagus taurus TaxID=166361 RepID=UPI0039BDABDD